jgi:hypothetical protein
MVSEPPNKRMQLTKLRAAPERHDKVPPCAPAAGMDGGTASQLIRSVRWTPGGAMMRLSAAVLSVTLTIVLPACYSEFPIDPTPQAELDAALLGTWRCLPPDPRPDTDAANFILSTARRGVYSIRLEAKDEEPVLLEAHFSLVNGHRLLNVRDLDPKGPSKPWLFARYSFPMSHVLRVQFVQDDVFKDSAHTPAAYRLALETLTDDSPLYEEYAVCVRTRADGSAWN